MPATDTIVALASPAGRGGVAVIRLSGPDLKGFAKAITGRALTPRHAALVTLHDAASRPLDQGIAIYFPGPRSYTGEDVLELQGHGGPGVVQEIIRRCLELGARLAQPGEFTQRAYLNGKLDLAQAEAVADLIGAASGLAVRGAMRSLSGAFSAEVRSLVEALIHIRVHVEASLDFPEEELDVQTKAAINTQVNGVKERINVLLASTRQGVMLREGIRIALVGKPNVGKSTLLNQLAGEELAIVTAVPGTTRDAISAGLAFDGVPVYVVDTAGLRDTQDEVEKIGIRRTQEAAARADVIVLITDITEGKPDDIPTKNLPAGIPIVQAVNKIDLVARAPEILQGEPYTKIFVSAKNAQGLELLRQAILDTAGWQPSGEDMFIARQRHLEALKQARDSLDRARLVQNSMELFAEELRQAQQALGSITGAFSADDLLGEIFSQFCIGK